MFEKFNTRRQATPREKFESRYPDLDFDLPLIKTADIMGEEETKIFPILAIFSFDSVDSFTNKKEQKVKLYLEEGAVILHKTNQSAPFYKIDEDIQIAKAIRDGLASVKITQKAILIGGELKTQFIYDIADSEK
ncbi:hypothetical protein [Herbiconiux daphne]|uniref:Uncharacterized protein n=1 Tax=Herbiconiux daphne TaxID=2970914 RepID=A0ABT2HAM4_9MICO|nr:hypothetical protein [Herbiconiux daphne]MCS5736916.1 hypothetical protein [Herbiconiux daphne]